MAAVKRGRTYFSSGPLVRFEVEGKGPGEELALTGSAAGTVHVIADVVSIAPLDALDIVVNGVVAQTVRPTDPLHVTLDGHVAVPEGGWVALRASGPKSAYLGDDYAFAQTTPVYVVRDGKRYLKAEDVQFLSDTVKAIWTRVEKSPWRSDTERDTFRAAIDRGQSVYQKLLIEAGAR